MQMAEGRRVAVFVNEFGSVDIDGDLIRWKGQIDEARRGPRYITKVEYGH